MKRALILVEGDSEEVFVKQILQPHFWSAGIHIEPTIAVTRREKSGANFRGGITSFGKFKNDVNRLLQSGRNAVITTMIDYYRLPNDFPGMDSRPSGSPLQRAEHVENAIHEHFGAPRFFIPYLSLHEFEALLFSSPTALARVITAPHIGPEFEFIRSGFTTPEDINERPGQSPSMRISALAPTYQKTLHGPAAALQIGLEGIRCNCPHFDAWIARVEAIGSELAN